LLPDLYVRAAEAHRRDAPRELMIEDRALLGDPVAAKVWSWLQIRFPDQEFDLDTSPQLDLGIDSLGWIDFTLALHGALHIDLGEAAVARILTVRDLLRECIQAAQLPPGGASHEMQPEPGFGRLDSIGHRALHIAIRGAMRLAYGVHADGVDRLPRPPFILCPNHTSFLDPFAVAAVLPYAVIRRTHWAGWAGLLFQTRARRAFSRIAHVLPVDPDRAAGASLDVAGAVLARGDSLVWFPEGERSRDGELHQIRPGIGVLIEKTRASVVPVRIVGAFAAWPRGRRWPRLGRITVRFGPPLEANQVLLPGNAVDRYQRAADTVREAIARLAL
jgi:long-chain acyl-CoA synthetase